ncbi:MAG TPA: LytTR family transcriptional regulator DNA-binding domain-containing protein [Opitutus sp.]|nr:LytTR family transcriptional regulator DNA-binding domain-containing protein [Opitutus sp.]
MDTVARRSRERRLAMSTSIQHRAAAAKGNRAPAVSAFPSADRFALRTPRGARLVRIAEIVTVTACENYTEVRLHCGERLLVRQTMKAWLSLLPAGSFARVHRQTIVNLHYLRGWQREGNHAAQLEIDGCRRPLRASYRWLREQRALVRRCGRRD